MMTVITPGPTVTSISQCNTGGGAQCCKSFGPAGTLQGASDALYLVGVILQDISLPVGLDCSPISIIDSNCAQAPVCCTNNSFNGLINLGCTEIYL
ncbi:hypothetical protein K439DRAFT_1383416 [Ramaria rubella]|nr:hypothetical protein K439DRAFT_1383416 [Ramaria rubella]